MSYILKQNAKHIVYSASFSPVCKKYPEDLEGVFSYGVTISSAGFDMPGIIGTSEGVGGPDYIGPAVGCTVDYPNYPSPYPYFIGDPVLIWNISVTDYLDPENPNELAGFAGTLTLAPYTLTVEGDADLMCEFEIVDSYHADHLGIGRWGNAANVLPTTELKVWYELRHPKVTLDFGDAEYYGGGSVEPFIFYGPDTSDQVIGIWLGAVTPSVVGGIEGHTYPWNSAVLLSTDDWVDWGTVAYSRSNGVCSEERTAEFTATYWGEDRYDGIEIYDPDDGSSIQRVAIEYGNGQVGLVGGCRNGQGVNLGASVNFADYCGEYTVDYTPDIRNYLGSERTDEWSILGGERHPRCEIDDTELEFYENEELEYSFVGGLPDYEYFWDTPIIEHGYGGNPVVIYKGMLEVWGMYVGTLDVPGSNAPGDGGWFIDLNVNPSSQYLEHGGLALEPIKSVGETEAISGEPSHPVWQPEPGEDESDWWDNELLVSINAPVSIADALQLTLTAPGDIPVAPVDFGELTGWVPSECSIEVDSGQQKVTVGATTDAYIEIADTLADKMRLTGTAFAKVFWTAPVGAEVVLHIGGHAWTLVSTGAAYTMIDLCHPDMSTVGDESDPDHSAMQSIAPYELPLDASDMVTYERKDDTAYTWEYPAGWGVGRVVSLKIGCRTPNTVYYFDKITLYRKEYADGGFARVYVFPHQQTWNDDRDEHDFAWNYCGKQYVPSGGGHYNERYAIRKWILVIDGAAVLEGVAGICELQEPEQYPVYTPTKLYIDGVFSPLAWPLDDYADPAAYATNGVVSVAPFTGDSESEFTTEFCLSAWLAGEVLEENQSTHTITFSMEPSFDYVTQHMNVGSIISGTSKRFQGGAQGIAWVGAARADTKSIHAGLSDPSPGHGFDGNFVTNRLGWFDAVPLNTKGEVELHRGGTTGAGGGGSPRACCCGGGPAETILLRNRCMSRVSGLE